LNASQDLVVNTFVNEPRVANVSADLCKWIVQQPEAFTFSEECLQKVVLRPEVFDVIIWQGTAASTDCCMGYNDKTELRDVIQEIGYRMITSDKFKNSVMDSIVYSTMKSGVTFGIYPIIY